MAFALRCLFFLLAIGGLIWFLYAYRAKTNQIVLIVVLSYGIGAGSRLLRLENDEELILTSVLALIGLAAVYVGVWMGARYFERRGL